MKPLSECALYRKLSGFCGTLSHYNVRGKYDITVGLYADETTHTPESSHHFSGNKRQGLFQLLALGGLAVVALGLLRGLWWLIFRR